VAVRTDVSDEASVQNMVDEGVKAFGSIQYCVNSAGITSSPRVKTAEMTAASYDRVLGVNLRGVLVVSASSDPTDAEARAGR